VKTTKVSSYIEKWFRIAAWLALAAIAIVTVLPIGLRPTTPYSPNIERFCVMAVVGGLFVLAYPRRLWVVLGILVCATALLEPLQFFALGRHPSFYDVVVKSAGAATGAIAGYFSGLVCFGELGLKVKE
jgi:hypothetical protein